MYVWYSCFTIKKNLVLLMWLPVKHSHSLLTLLPMMIHTCIDVSQLHTFYYDADLICHRSEMFTPVLRSEFGNLMGILKTIDLILLSTHKIAQTSSFSNHCIKSPIQMHKNHSTVLIQVSGKMRFFMSLALAQKQRTSIKRRLRESGSRTCPDLQGSPQQQAQH